MKENKNYHSRLLGLSRIFDDVIEEIKDSYRDEKYSNWLVYLLCSPLLEIGKVNKRRKGIEKFFNLSLVQAVFPMITGTSGVVLAYFQNINPWMLLGLGFLLGYFFMLPIYYSQMLTFKSGHFHAGAYRKFRRQEYNLFRSAFLDDKRDFFFKGLYDYVGEMASHNSDALQIYGMIEDKLDRHLEREKKQLQTKVSVLKDRLKRKDKDHHKATEKYENFIDSLLNRRQDLIEGLEFIISLIKDINIILYRMRNGVFSTKDLNILSGFTIFQLENKKLVKIEDVGTTGSTPTVLSLNSKRNWGAIEVVKKNLDNPVVNTPYLNHTVISYKMKMGIDSGGTWVYNFHFDSDDKKAMHLLEKDDIMDSREVYRLIHALCLLSQGEFQFTSKKEALRNDQ
ncbi:hypothetical protein [Gracilibacillus sp. YIM 98692]|uniref:hypothetical protein n=1 Tax=Gracilibacillus sp. YIM 98692 TaxID=2663532 RepID=UPI0013D0D2AF|nr:hypothetical protein [Gracilibacillus sp. YIM 98692]